jgi:hypothetical protein
MLPWEAEDRSLLPQEIVDNLEQPTNYHSLP